MSLRKRILPPAAVALAVLTLVAWVAARPAFESPHFETLVSEATVHVAAERVDDLLQAMWLEASVSPAERAEELQVFRRLALALVGAPPSLEEIRQFESDHVPDRLQRWTSRFIADGRFVEYFTARLGDAFIDPAAEELKPHQRDRFRSWLGSALQQGSPYSQIVCQLISDRGFLVDRPGATFVSWELSLGEEAAQRLAARTSRAFLGQRIDCAQCHDHPFAEWTQLQFESLAAYYGQVQFRHARVQDTSPRPFVIADSRTQQERTVAPEVPFDSEWVPDRKHLREELASWITHPQNRRFRRAIANRVWGLMFGRAFIAPVDDLPDPPSPDKPDVLDLLATDLGDHGDDLRRLIHVIAATRAFGLASSHEELESDLSADRLAESWAIFPVTELTPQQMIRSMQQAACLRTVSSATASAYSAIRRYELEHRFVQEYGVAGGTEDAQASTIPHTVQRLSGRFTRRHSEATLLTAAGRIAAMSSSAKACLENCYLACLSRRPTDGEREHFEPRLSDNLNRRADAVEDVYWTLFNSAEFCWNH